MDGQAVARESVTLTEPPRFYDVEYPIPPALVRGKEKTTLRFEASEGSQVATVFAVRVVRESVPR
jgi:hypothetical protein